MKPFLEALERLQLVRDGYYSDDWGQHRRAAMILAVDRGTPVSSVARLAGCSRTSVYYWIRLYRHHRDPEALANAHSRGLGQWDAEVAAMLNAIEGREPPLPSVEAATTGLLLRLDATIAADPRRRRKAAILWALDRGVPPTHVARVAKVSRQAIHQLRRRRARPEPPISRSPSRGED